MSGFKTVFLEGIADTGGLSSPTVYMRRSYTTTRDNYARR